MKIPKKLSAIIFSLGLLSANYVYSAGESVSNKIETTDAINLVKLEAVQAKQAMLSYKSKLEAFQAELEALKAESAIIQRQAEIAANDEQLKMVEVSRQAEIAANDEQLKKIEASRQAEIAMNDQAEASHQAELEAVKAELEAISFASKLADSAILCYKGELEAVRTELDSFKAQVAAASHQREIAAAQREVQALEASRKAELEGLKNELAAMKAKIATSSQKTASLESGLVAKAPAPMLAATNTTDLYIPEKEKVQKNDLGQTLWQSKSEEDLNISEAKEYNYDSFKAELSPFALHEWSKFTPEMKRKAMEYADRTQLSPDAAVFKIDPNY